MDLSKEAPICSILVEIVHDVDDKKDRDFLETLLVAYPLLGVGVPIGEAIEALCS